MAELSDETMMVVPEEWPRWPYLPLKRYVKSDENGGTRAEFGFMVDGAKFTVFCGSIFSLPASLPNKKHEYNSPKDILADGWVVD